MASPYADALPDFAGPGRRVLRQGARQKCAGFSEMRVLPNKAQVMKHDSELKITYSIANVCQNQDTVMVTGKWEFSLQIHDV